MIEGQEEKARTKKIRRFVAAAAAVAVLLFGVANPQTFSYGAIADGLEVDNEENKG